MRGLVLALLALAALGCRKPAPAPRRLPPPQARPRALERLGFAVQAGAFAQPENAARLAAQLRAQGLEATHLPGPRGLFRVRFGDFPTREAARQRAEALRASGLLEGYWIVTPQEQPAAQAPVGEAAGLRRALVETARGFLGTPYLWGGTTEQGFDCSGLTQAVYQLGGLRLPRSAQAQFDAGRPVAEADLQPGDLVFFALGGGSRVSHVGLYLGGGTFIHAPSSGKTVGEARLDLPAFRDRFLGGRGYF